MIAVTAGYTFRPYVQHLATDSHAERTLCGMAVRALRQTDNDDLDQGRRVFHYDAAQFSLCGLCECRKGWPR